MYTALAGWFFSFFPTGIGEHVVMEMMVREVHQLSGGVL